MADETPLFSQYLSIKAQYPNEVLFFRLGDFYEMFDDDAKEISRLLNLTLTQRTGRPMCGIPYHASKVYIARLLRLGKKIAIAEQVGEIAKGKGLTERKVVEVITPGTATETEYLDGGVNNYLASIFIDHGKVGFAFIDVTTGDFRATSFNYENSAEDLRKELGRCMPKEILLSEKLRSNQFVQQALESLNSPSLSFYPDWNFNYDVNYKRLVKQFKTINLNSFSLFEDSVEVPAAGFLIDYLEKTTNTQIDHIRSINIYKDYEYVIIDDSSRRNLEILSNLRDGSSDYTLLECLNCAKTSMGSRMLRSWLMFPLTDYSQICKRQNHVEYFTDNRSLLNKFRELLNGILDVERLAGRVSMDRAHGKDLQALKISLQLWNRAREILSDDSFTKINYETSDSIINMIDSAIIENPATTFTEGRVIKDGWSNELDYWRKVQTDFNLILDEYAQEEKDKTGIQNLRIKNSGNMGYFIEVTHGKLDKVPSHFVLKRTLVNADRYTTEKLQELEKQLNESASRILELEHDLFIELRNNLKPFVAYLQDLSREIAYADVLSSFAESAIRYSWTKPHISEGKEFIVQNGRHPVVENHLPSGEFVPNDLELFSESVPEFFALITGPNMAGKSTFLRQNALICLLAQTGAFVPASFAKIGIVDRIFCRVGASDNLARGESTFLVEMSETAHILRSATEHSLVIMDEVGRGTSTEDGLSIAWAVSEYLLNTICCKTFFATHYHELTRLEHDSIKMLCMAVSEDKNEIVFLRKVIEGSTENSYGIHVAKLAGIPEPVIQRANEILDNLQGNSQGRSLPETKTESSVTTAQQSWTGALFSDEELILDEILSLDVDNTTPVNALQLISRWKKTLSGR